MAKHSRKERSNGNSDKGRKLCKSSKEKLMSAMENRKEKIKKISGKCFCAARFLQKALGKFGNSGGNSRKAGEKLKKQ